jgi:hypothetical protein
MATARRGHGEAGGSMVEFAIVAPVLISLVMFATYFQEAVRTKLKNQEAARFAAWEFTALPLSNYVDRNHGSLFGIAKAKIARDVNTIYRDFDSAETNAPTSSFVAQTTLETGSMLLNDLPVPLESKMSFQSLPGVGGALAGPAGALLGGANKALDIVGPPAFGFNMNGMVEVRIDATFQNKLLPNQFFGQFKYGQIDRFKMTDTMYLVADGWTLHDGRDVVPDKNQTGASLIDGSGKKHPFASQVDAMSFLGLRDKLIPSQVQGWMGTVQSMLGAFGIPLADPIFLNGSPVVSINYKRQAGPTYTTGCNADAKNQAIDGRFNLEKNNTTPDKGQFCFHTIPFRTTFAYDDSPLVKVFNKSGPYYLGCRMTEASSTLACH